ncbi:hypothetical protein XNC3_2830008 [Xenorhabdus nematophila F1]|uniref:hypothetical protein n=1 Tax=Xenorhabdus nematophila TaxID=628 RepID=UPI0003275558|nr:hypothetical protein XNC3_2830008 [Xenorhabdus nematophila F1]CEF30098.1 hypothetical protein XNW1_2240008 [Xenorhabdus nematophila str. Websteri]
MSRDIRNNFKFSQRSENNLKGVHPDLVAVVHRAQACSDSITVSISKRPKIMMT